jgi:uncharacterized protein (TIGR02001 family)
MVKLMLGLAAAILSAPAGASDFNGSVGASSDYIWRGITKSAGNPILSASGRVDLESGPYVNVNFFHGVDFPASTESNNELDYTVGFAKDVGEGLFSFDVGYTYHTYVGKDTMGEVHASVSKGPVNVTAYRVVGEDFGKDPYIIGSINATDFIEKDLPVDVSVFFGTQFPAKNEKRVNDYGMVTSVNISEQGSLNYKLAKHSEDSEVTHTVGLTLNF